MIKPPLHIPARIPGLDSSMLALPGERPLTKPPAKLRGNLLPHTPKTEEPRYFTEFDYNLPLNEQGRPLWVDVLRQCKYPDEVVVIDFETYFDSEYTLKELSTIEYIMDKRWEVLGVAITRMDGRHPFDDHRQHTHFWRDAEARLRTLQDEYGDNLEKCTVVIQNARFDATILSRRYNIHPPYVIDTSSLARHLNSRRRVSLKLLCKHYGLPDKGDTMEFAGCSFRKRYRKAKGRKSKPPVAVPPMSDEKAVALAKYAEGDAMREWELFTIMLPLLSNPTVELPLQQHTLELFTKPCLQVDKAKGEQLIADMEAEIAGSLPEGVTQEEISGNKTFDALMAAALAEAGDNNPRYWKPTKNGKWILAIAKADEERTELLNHESPKVRALMAARVGVKSWPLHIGRVQGLLAVAEADGGRLAIPLTYHGAHTGRWSGGEGINPQNFGSRSHPLVNAVREIIIATPGHKLVIVDEAAIEARVCGWIAGQDDLVEKFKNGEEIYCGFASRVLGYNVRKPKKSGGIPKIERRMGWARNSVGKVGVLGCGYGMGAEKAVGYAGGAIDLATAQKIVEQYRAENKKIVQFWSDIEDAFLYTAKYGKPCRLKWLAFEPGKDCHVTIVLPNGRHLHYPVVKIVKEERYEKLEVWNELHHKWEHVWGGHLTENVVQAISRDTLAEAMLRCEAKGIHTALHVHDELVALQPADKAEWALKTMIAELSTTPTWGPGMPLAAEGQISDCYKK